MALNVISNYAANVAQRYLQKADSEATRSVAKLAAGSRVLSARDDAASLAVGLSLKAAATFARLYLHPVDKMAVTPNVRMAPVW